MSPEDNNFGGNYATSEAELSHQAQYEEDKTDALLFRTDQHDNGPSLDYEHERDHGC